MTGIGYAKHDATGHSTGKRKTNGAMKIEGQFAPYPIDMLGSPAYGALSLSGHRVLSRVVVEHGQHGGFDNGQLPVTFNDFEAFGIDRHSIAPGIRECVALGFLEITRQGRSGNGDFRQANVFRVTFLPMRGVKPTHDWRKIETDEQAQAIARVARSSKAARLPRRARSLTATQGGLSSQDIDSGGETPTVNAAHSSGENPHCVSC
jgi:hypothetical protein